MNAEQKKRAHKLAEEFVCLQPNEQIGDLCLYEQGKRRGYIAGFEAGLNDPSRKSISFEDLRSAIVSNGLISDFTGYGFERYIAELATQLGIELPKKEVGCD